MGAAALAGAWRVRDRVRIVIWNFGCILVESQEVFQRYVFDFV